MALNREYTVTPFDGANFSVWNRRVKAIFAAKELDNFLEKEADATNDTEVSKSKKAYAILLTLLDDKILSSLQKEDTAFKIWKALISTYEAKGAVNQILTRKRLATIRKSKETSMRQHIDEILKLVSDLRVSGAEVSDIDSIVYILMSLPKEYESVKVALENQPNSDIDDLWHRRCGHSCNQSLKQLGLPSISSFCEVCTRAKQCATPVGKGPRRRETVPMVMIHTDICGPIVPKTFAGEQYFMTLIDDYSRFTEVRLLKRKSDAASELKNFCQLNPSVKKIRCDNGKEYVDGDFLKFANEAGIKIDPSPPYTPCLNGIAERANRSLLEKGRAMIFESNLPKNFWSFAVLTAAYINNRMPNASIDCHTPYYLKYNTHADLKNLRVFGCDAYTLIPNSQRKKLDDKCKKMIFIGYSSMGYRLLDPTTKRIIISKNVKFNEEKKSSNDFNYVSPNIDGSELDAENQSEESETDIFEPSTEQSEDTSEGSVRKSSREKKHPIRFPESKIYQAMLSQEETQI
ncbi:Retrovirus-related Pol polyprotein from transposon TNT 1-94 [Araneus ventricosus]|uniref:Retrovirus-related Pol polyprotein from transposon TNT 1-94 n=1 Tax=Araneus ventricosus TaxID=182803 RepID=A0A4Y2M093_ARAVE|nr:Retrovirus-related Pol polyprotein from transposon TNT 1-94 [Araneus ventricosus]